MYLFGSMFHCLFLSLFFSFGYNKRLCYGMLCYVKEFVYLDSLLTWNNDCTKEIKRRMAKAKGVMAGLNTIWNSKQISYKSKLNVLKTCVFSTALNACETWTIKK